MTLEVTIQNSALVTSVIGGKTQVVVGAIAPVTALVNSGTTNVVLGASAPVTTTIVSSNTQVLLGATAPVTLTIGTFLPVPGPTGAIGPAMSSYTHTQSSASTLWTVNHNLGHRPIVTVFSAGGVEVEAGIVHISTNQVQISFTSAVTGTAIFL